MFRSLRAVAGHPFLPPLLIAAMSLVLSAILSRVAPLPQPQFHDEFSYLLAADTFAHGRLTNQPHKLWPFFETFQVLSQPTYASKYPPGQGMMLALGQFLGAPIAGVWVSTALGCAAAWWAMAQFMPRRWATLGAIVIALHPMILGWNWSYWGGAVAMIGGCLVVGATARGAGGGRVAGIALGAGIVVLLNTRPYEGIVLVALCLLARSAALRTSAKYAATVVGIGIAWIGYYNHRVTGSATTFPYMLYEKTYAATGPMIFMPAPHPTPQYRHPVMRDYHLSWELPRYRQQRTLAGFCGAMAEKLWSFARAYFRSPVLLTLLVALPVAIRRDSRLRRISIIAAVFLPATLLGLWFFPHYTAPAAVLYFAILVQCLRHLRARLRQPAFVWTVLALHLLAAAFWFAGTITRDLRQWNYQRASLIASLHREGGKHLVFVRTPPDYYAHNEWVYNDADIDAARVVWARDMGDEANRTLKQYFRTRTTWMLQLTAQGARLIDYQR